MTFAFAHAAGMAKVGMENQGGTIRVMTLPAQMDHTHTTADFASAINLKPNKQEMKMTLSEMKTSVNDAKGNKKTHYLNNKEFEQTIKNYLQTPDEYEDELVQKLDILITNIIHTFKFKIDPDDAKQECFLLALLQ